MYQVTVPDVQSCCIAERPILFLFDGPSHNDGRLEIKINGEFGTVCDDGFGETEAKVVCRQLGLPWQVVSNIEVGSGSRNFKIKGFLVLKRDHNKRGNKKHSENADTSMSVTFDLKL